MEKSKNNSSDIIIQHIVEDEVVMVSCHRCQACCCHLEVMLITDTGVPDRYIQQDEWGAETMLRLDDGWCAALDRNTHLCTIYEVRPLICREFTEGEPDCHEQRKKHLRL